MTRHPKGKWGTPGSEATRRSGVDPALGRLAEMLTRTRASRQTPKQIAAWLSSGLDDQVIKMYWRAGVTAARAVSRWLPQQHPVVSTCSVVGQS